MLKKLTFFASILICAGTFHLFAQTKLADTVLLREVVVGQTRQNFETGYSLVNLSAVRRKEYASSSLSGLLSDQTGITINTYGPIGQASVSIRGTGSNHTAVVWNGINLQSSMNGGVDLSLMSCQLFDQVSIQLGGSSALYGSGAVGGVVFLNNSSEIQQGLKVSASQHIGSFGTRNSLFSINLANKQVSSSTKLSVFSTENNFPFYNTESKEGKLDTVKNSSQHQWSVLENLNWKASNKDLFSFHAWLVGSRYHIARTMLQTEQEARQDEHNSRFVTAWLHQTDLFNHTFRMAWVHNEMNYVDSTIHPWHVSSETTAEYETKADFDAQHSLYLGAQAVWERAVSTDYSDTKTRNRYALSGGYKQSNLKHNVELGINARSEMVDGGLSPFTASLGLEYKTNATFLLKTNLSRNFRLPTFNDLYWQPMGNDKLKPENGWSTDLGFQAQTGSDNLNLKLSATAFSNWVKDLIVWLPGRTGLYTPSNLNFVWSRGFELGISSTARLGSLGMGCNASYTYSKSNKKVNGTYSSDQMLYIPAHKASVYTYLNFHQVRLSYTHKLESIRLFSESLNGSKANQLDGYGLGIVSLSAYTHLFGLNISYGAKVNNLWNASYQVMPWYPMPLRNYMVFLSFEFER